MFLESPSNPTLELVDIAAVAELAHEAGARLVVDNVFATPLGQRPLELGADIVVYSTTKHIDGQGRASAARSWQRRVHGPRSSAPFLRHTGPALSPFNAWLLLKGLETLDLRVAQQVRNAAELAGFLDTHPKVERVFYPGLASHPQAALAKRQMANGGALIAFSIKGGKEATFRFLDALEIIEYLEQSRRRQEPDLPSGVTTHQSLDPGAPRPAGHHRRHWCGSSRRGLRRPASTCEADLPAPAALRPRVGFAHSTGRRIRSHLCRAQPASDASPWLPGEGAGPM